MKTVRKMINCIAVSMMAMLWLLCMTALADSGDNSLYDLGLENAVSLDPEFYYSTLEYNVTVAKGTTELYLSPVTSDPDANIIDLSGTLLDDDGNGTVYITVEAVNGAQVTYTLHVSSDGSQAAAEGEGETEAETTDEQAQMAELQRQSESEEALRKEAELQSAQQAVESLTTQNANLTDRMNLLMKVMYGLIGFAVLLLIFMINQSLRNKDLKDDLKEAKSLAEANNEFARKEQTMQNSYYYNTPQNMAPQQNARPLDAATQNVQAAFGNAPQVLQAQPSGGQVNAPAGQTQTAQQAAPGQPAQQAPAEPTLVQSQVQEPDVNVEMIDL